MKKIKETTRRQFLATAATTVVGLTIAGKSPVMAGPTKCKYKISMYDASMDCPADIKSFATAKKIGLDGVQVNAVVHENSFILKLRDPKVQAIFKKEAKKYGIEINSIAMGICNQVPLKSEPVAAVWVADTIGIAKNLGAKNILMACFGKGEIHPEDETEMRRVKEVLKALAPRAEENGIILGLESTLNVDAHLEIIEAVNSPYVQVYYDIWNMVNGGNDPIKEIKTLGGYRICEVHCKEGPTFLGGSGKVDWPTVAETLKETGFEGWLTLETASPTKNIVADTQKNTQFLRELFA